MTETNRISGGTGADQCSGCGLNAPGGDQACKRLFDGRIDLVMTDHHCARLHRLVVDCYCLQHPSLYCISAKSLMAHLGGLCIALEHGADQAAYKALQRSLNGRPDIGKPPLPAPRGSLTIADVLATSDPAAYAEVVQAWAADIWQAYAPLQGYARLWLQKAHAPPPPDRSKRSRS